MTIKQDAAKGGFWLAGFTTISQAVSWAATIGIANFLSPEDYGLMTMASFLTAYIEFLSEMGIGASVIQKDNINRKELSSLFWLSIIMGIICFAIAQALVYPTAAIFHDKRIIPVTSLIAPIFIIGSIASIPNAILRRDFKLKYVGISNMIAALVSCISQFYFASHGFGVYTLIIGTIILRSVKTVCICFFAKWLPLLHFKISDLKPFLKYGLNLAGGAFMFKIFQSLDSFIVGKKFNATVLGNYNFASSLASIPTDKIWPIFQQALFPLLSRLQQDVNDRNKTFLSALKYCAYITFPLYIAGFFLAHDIILGLLGEKWLPIVFMFRVFCIVKILELLTEFCNLLFTSSGRAKEILIFSFIRLLLMPISIFFASLYGFNYIFIPWITIYPVICIGWIVRTLLLYKINMKEFLKSINKPILTSVVLIVSAILIKIPLTTVHQKFLSERFFVISYISIGGVICLLYVVFFDKHILQSLLQIKKAKKIS
jgi:O-antigen/teichoic acid export membrane protein